MVALLAGVAGGAVLTAAAGARRTHSALERHLVAYRFPDAWLHLSNSGPTTRPTKRTIQRDPHAIPDVQASAVTGLLSYCARDAQNRPVSFLGPQAVQFLVNIDGRDGVAAPPAEGARGPGPRSRAGRARCCSTRAQRQRFGVRRAA